VYIQRNWSISSSLVLFCGGCIARGTPFLSYNGQSQELGGALGSGEKKEITILIPPPKQL
jgi:hypothetical protein